MRGRLSAPDVYQELLSCRDRGEHIADIQTLASWLKPHCKLNRLGMRGTRLRILQHPNEFSQWLIFMAEQEVKSYLEIGTSTGGSFMTTDSYLRATVPGFRGSVGYDKKSKLRDFELYRAKFPSCVFRHQSSGSMKLGNERFDACLIDARHLEHWVLHDFEKVRKNVRWVAFHDIVLQSPDGNMPVYPAWQKIKAQHNVWKEWIETSVEPRARCGIGMVDTESLK